LIRFLRASAQRPAGASVGLFDLLGAPVRLLFGPNPPGPLWWAGSAVLLRTAALAAWRPRPERMARAGAGWLAFWLVVPAGFVLLTWLAAQGGANVFLTRYQALVLPAAAVGAGSLFATLPRPVRAPLIAGVVALTAVAIGQVYTYAGEQRDDWRGLVGALERSEAPGDLVVFDQGW